MATRARASLVRCMRRWHAAARTTFCLGGLCFGLPFYWWLNTRTGPAKSAA
jgi:hypothetical protein